MARVKSDPEAKPHAERKRAFAFTAGVCLVAVAGLIWFMQREANDMELEREMRKVPGGETWMTECDTWVKDGPRREGRAIWVGKVDELVRTDPEDGAPVLLALKLAEVRRIAGDVDRKVDRLYVSARGFDFVGRKWDEPLTGHRWLVATYENEHGQRYLFSALPAPGSEMPAGEVVK